MAQANSVMKDIWTRFIHNKETPEDVRKLHPIVYESWKRSREMGIDPRQSKEEVFSGQQLEQCLADNQMLISIAASYMESLSSFLEGETFSVVITGPEAIILKDEGGTSVNMVENKIQTHMRVGSNRNESYVGTNSTGTCMLLDKPLQIRGEEHYLEAHHIFSCSSAPIHHNGEIIGSLSMVGPAQAHHRHTLGMVVAAADGIEKEFRLRSAYNKIQLTNSQLSSTLQSLASGVVMIDNNGTVIQHNERICKTLHLHTSSFTGQQLADIIHIESLDTPLHLIEDNFYSREVLVTIANNQTIVVLLTACTIHNANGIRAGTVLTFDVAKHINRIVNQRSGFAARYTFNSIIGNSPQIHNSKRMGHVAAQRNSTVLILGESGTGKELYAQAIHNASSRAAHPFIAINCGSLPADLIESELFGYVGGAFTGASKEGQPGKFELADKGTIFLDEIGDMPLGLQVSLLRVLQLREITRIGGKNTTPIDVRIIAATNQNLEAKIRDNTFRSDLYYRLNVFPITLPPLRERREDVQPLVEYFIKSYRENGIAVDSIDGEALHFLEEYDWPGNVRELQNVIERAINLAQSNAITTAQLPNEVLSFKSPGMRSFSFESATQKTSFSAAMPAHSYTPDNYTQRMKNTEKEMVVTALQKAGGNVSRASQMLGISRKTLYCKIKDYQVDVSVFRSGF